MSIFDNPSAWVALLIVAIGSGLIAIWIYDRHLALRARAVEEIRKMERERVQLAMKRQREKEQLDQKRLPGGISMIMVMSPVADEPYQTEFYEGLYQSLLASLHEDT